ncbi:MAG: aminotransferase class IV family protein [Bacteroidetes bacterium]|nr:aminotransferase class IV family protein [Bacteroidota bacterium]
MSPLFETIKVEKRKLQHLPFHSARMNRARKALFGIDEKIDLNQIIQIPEQLSNDIYKCRVTYDREISKIEFEKHIPRVVETLKIITSSDIDYPHKYLNRQHLKELYERRENCDDVLIIKDGFVTDTSFSNIIFWDGEQWITPATPLLKGTTRERLIQTGRISARKISNDDLKAFTKARIINALTDFEDKQDVKLVF